MHTFEEERLRDKIIRKIIENVLHTFEEGGGPTNPFLGKCRVTTHRKTRVTIHRYMGIGK